MMKMIDIQEERGGILKMNKLKSWQKRGRRLHEDIAGLSHSDMDGPWTTYDKRFLALALAGEVGELANYLKKEWRGDPVDYTPEIVKELADINIYLDLLARCYNVDLDKVTEAKLKEVEKRWKGKL